MDPFTITDIAIGIMALVIVSAGLFRGISGEIASLAGLAGAFCAAVLLDGQAATVAAKTGCSQALFPVVAGAVKIGFGIVAYGITRALVGKFVSMCVPQPTDALLGMAVGAAKVLAIVAALVWFGIAGTDETDFLQIKSPVLVRIAEVIGRHASGGEIK